jgi:hypothetical protein
VNPHGQGWPISLPTGDACCCSTSQGVAPGLWLLSAESRCLTRGGKPRRDCPVFVQGEVSGTSHVHGATSAVGVCRSGRQSDLIQHRVHCPF